eukprot:556837-Prymnesium_polylepis.1
MQAFSTWTGRLWQASRAAQRTSRTWRFGRASQIGRLVGAAASVRQPCPWLHAHHVEWPRAD